MPEPDDRKLFAKRFNEHAKLLAALFNVLSIATFGAAFVVPLSKDNSMSSTTGIGF